MGMDLFLNTNVITKKEYEELKGGKLYINKYNLSLLSSEKIEQDKKAFYFDLLCNIIQNKTFKDVGNILEDYYNSENTIYFYDFLKQYYKDNLEETLKYNIYYDEDEFDCYIDYDIWINCEEATDGYLERDVEEVDNSVVLIQARYW